MSGCTEPAEQGARAHEQALDEDVACSIEDKAPEVTLAPPNAMQDDDVAVAANGALRVTVHNESSESGSVSIRIRSRSEQGWNRATFEAGEVAADGSLDVDLSAATLALPGGAFDYSGSLTLVADLEMESGHRAQSAAVHVFFHPTETGWLVYDAAGRASRHDDGALTEQARAQRTAIVPEDGATVAFAGRSQYRQISKVTNGVDH